MRIEKRGIHLNVLPLALLHHLIDIRYGERGQERRAGRALDAVVGPEFRFVGADGGGYGCGGDEGGRAGVRGGEGGVVVGMPVFGGYFEGEGEGEEVVDCGDYGEGVGDC